jgi:hypothetical protein
MQRDINLMQQYLDDSEDHNQGGVEVSGFGETDKYSQMAVDIGK